MRRKIQEKTTKRVDREVREPADLESQQFKIKEVQGSGNDDKFCRKLK